MALSNEAVHDLGDHQIGQQQLVGGGQEPGRARRLVGRVAGQMSDQDVGVNERAHRLARDRAART
jgi:hypothetical protein